MKQPLLLCTDLDRTLLPNGMQPESEDARALFSHLAQQHDVTLVYVTGRHRALVLEAIDEFRIPVPDYVIGDVGSSIYEISNGEWQPWRAWQEEIETDWQGSTPESLQQLFAGFDGLRLQESEKQNRFKLSYYAPQETDVERLCAAMQERLKPHNIRASLIWSIDDLTHAGLLDVLPQRATKLHAIEFLMQHKGYARECTVFAGDSGNDLPVLASHIQSVLVANARDDVRAQALAMAAESGFPQALYLARGGLLGMNGNYAAGILEGVVHFIPEAMEWISG